MACVAYDEPTVIYVSESGSDTGTGTEARPFRTLERARAAVRERNVGMTSDIHVKLSPGTYEVSTTFELGDADSGFNGFRVIYEAANGPETVRILGGRRITNWQALEGEILTAPIPDDWIFHTLYENGLRADQARFPNRMATGSRRGPYLVSAGAIGSHRHVGYGMQPLPPLGDDLSSLRVFIWSNAGHAWFTDIAPVSEVRAADRQLVLGVDTRYEIGVGSRFYLQGALSLLDAPGEMFLDRERATLYYWPRDVASSEIIAPMVTTLVSLRGAHDIVFSALRFEATDFADTYRFGVPTGDFERQIEMPEHRSGMIVLEETQRVRIEYSHLVNAGYGGIYMLFANEGAEIYGNLIEHVGINGVTIQGAFPGHGDVARNNSITNNLIRYVGETVGNAAGIDISNSGHNVIANDRIHDSPRFGFILHAIAQTAGDVLYAEGNEVRSLEITSTCQDSGDAGALYIFGLSQPGTASRTNSFGQISIGGITPDPSMQDLLPNGLFTDNDSGMQRFEDIRIVETPGDPYRSNDARGHQFENVSWQGDFDHARFESTDIGLRPDFPTIYLDEP
jgi:hypothetical protein